MKRELFTLLVILVALLGKAQEKECFGLYTDRDLYTSGENILVRVIAPSDESDGILKVDLFNSKGDMIVSVPLKMTFHQADGFISLHDTLSTGSYLVRTSTQTSTTQTIKELFVINRFTGIAGSGTTYRPSGSLTIQDTANMEISLSGVEKRYKTRGKGHLTVQLTSGLQRVAKGSLFLYVAQVLPDFNSRTFVTEAHPKFTANAGNEGLIISGTVTDKTTAQPFRKGVVSLSVPDSVPRFNYYTTGENGRFYFELKDCYGKVPIVLQCSDPEGKQQLKINLDKTENLLPSLPPFKSGVFPPELRSLAAKNVEALNFSKIFRQQWLDVQSAPMSKAESYPFYGVPVRVIYPRLFVDLTNFEEISRELLQGIKFRDNNHVPTFQILDAQRNNYFSEQPLVLVNGVPVRNFNDIKDLGSKEIERIETSQFERYFGNMRFSGVIAIYAPKFDFEVLKESEDLRKFTIDAVQQRVLISPAPDEQSKMADLRPVLLWLPSIQSETNIEADFQTSDIRGKFRVFLGGRGMDGKLFFKEQFFEVN